MLKRGEKVYKDNNTKCMLNSLLSIFLNTFERSFPVKYKSIGNRKNKCITQRIKTTCKVTRDLYIHSRNMNTTK